VALRDIGFTKRSSNLARHMGDEVNILIEVEAVAAEKATSAAA
jgi:hypothetical protein